MDNNLIIMIAIVAYMLFVIVTGILIGKGTKKNSEGFFLGGRKMGPIVTAMSAEASDMSSYLLMGIPGLAYLSGFADASWTAIGLAVGTYFNFLLVAKKLRVYSEKINAITIPDFFSKRFGDTSKNIETIAAIIIIIFFVPYVASGLSAIGKLLNTVLGWEYNVGLIIGAVVIMSYSIFGGFGSVAIMDLIQSIIMTFALAVIVIFALDKAGGIDSALNYTNGIPGFLDLFSSYSQETGTASEYGVIRIFSTLAWGLGYFGMPHILVRFMSIRNENELKYSRRIASVWVLISMFVAILIGIVGIAVSNVGSIPLLQGSETERVIIYLAKLLAENGLFFAIVAGIILAGILAATMSTADSQLLCAAASISENIVQNKFKIKLTPKQSLFTARVSIIIIVAIAIIFALDPNSKIFTIVSFAWAGFGACFGPIMLLALYSKNTNKTGVISGMVVGAIMIFLWKFYVRPLGGAFDIYELLPAFLINLFVTIIVSKFTKKPSEEIIETYESVMKK